jgi:CRP/FNR family transcriptional regulator
MAGNTTAPNQTEHDLFPCQDCKVRNRSLCSALNQEELAHLNSLVTHIDLKHGDALFYEEDESNYLYNLTEGVVQLSRLLPDGRRQITGFLFPGDFLGLSKEGNYAYTAEAVSSAKLCRFRRGQMMKMFDEYPGLEKKLLSQRSNELIEAQEHIILLGRKSAKEKVASLLMNFAKKMSQTDFRLSEINLPVTREDMADYLGMRLETVSRVLSDFKKSGLIDLPSPHIIKFNDMEALEDIATGMSSEN